MVSKVAHFADQHDVRVFTKGGAQRVGEALGVSMQFALVHHAILVHVHEFDRIFDGENVVVPLGVDLVDHGSEGGGFAGAGRTGDQHQAARLFAHLADDCGKPELVERLDLEWNETEDRRCRAALIENVGAESGQSFQAEREIQFKVLFEAMLLGVGHHAVGELLGFRRSHLRKIERNQVSVHANLRR